ncbi:Homeobox-containing protein 1 [Holothuria leucospilota]|uniref:Homeobox-containing protein 1 n=1 Tax=Holothuria leucospilota TaxID=206669 RepID=A0A9Q1BV66_HOLLE|nr:Homeobox-containing protein 1 [Holothuria leucospilota]
MAEEPRYTIEQIELLRRLIRTGLSRDDIIHAVDSMTRYEREFSAYSPHTTSRSDHSPLHSPLPVQQASPQPSVNGRFDLGHSSGAAASGDTVLSDVDTTSYQSHLSQQVSSPGPIIASVGRQHEVMQTSPSDVEGSQERYTGKLKVDEFQVADEEIQALLSKGLPAVRDEIREFLIKNNLSQNQLGRDIGVTGSYISQYFHSVRSMRNGTIALMCKWFIGKKRELEAGQVAPPVSNSTNQYHHTNYENFIRAPTNRFSPYSHSNIELAKNFKIRRERFVWKESCTKVLEAYFKKNPYPNDLERIRLSDACNAMQQIPGHAIPESCIVTPERVYHWFANRRKELNKRKRLSEIIPVSLSQTQEAHSSAGPNKSPDDSQSMPFPGLTSSRDQGKDGDPLNRDCGDQVIVLEGDDDHPRDPKEIASQLQEVNNSIITFMKAVEEKTDEEELENKAGVAMLNE